MPPDITWRRASNKMSLLARLGTKPIAPRSIARITSLARSDAETTTTGNAGYALRSSGSSSKPSASPSCRSSNARSKSLSFFSVWRAARALPAPITVTSSPSPWITAFNAARISG